MSESLYPTGRMNRFRVTGLSLVLAVSSLSLLAACTTPPAPVEDRSTARVSQHAVPDGYYRVSRGDSLHSIAFHYGLDWRDIARWNGIRPPYTIYPEQELRLGPPQPKPTVTTRAARPQPAVNERAVDRPAEPPRSETRSASTTTVPATSAPAPAANAEVPGPAVQDQASRPQSPPPGGASTVSTADPDTWLWPVKGQILSSFRANDPARNGIEIGGKEGQAIVAAAAGEVVYSGNGLIGYGELIIIKHSDRMLSAYAHNRERLVTEGQAVSAGEKIAEMGRDDRNRAMLHFEIRRDGNPQDPLKYLPGR